MNSAYDPIRDAWASVYEAYRVIRERVAAGGPPWELGKSSIGEPAGSTTLIRRGESEPVSDPGLPAGSPVDEHTQREA